MKKKILIALLALAAFNAHQAQAQSGIQIQKQPATVDERRFDPRNLPDPPPPVPYGLKAVTHYDFYCYADATCEWIDDGATLGNKVQAKVRLKSLNVNLSLPLTVWLPLGASDHLREHELGHTRIDKHVYETADQAAEQAGRSLLGQVFTGTGRDLDEARNNGISTAIDEFCHRYQVYTKGTADRLNERYDRLTNHGRNDMPVEEAIEQTYSEARSASNRRWGRGLI